MKKNIKIGLMAGLLITPAIVAQADSVQASDGTTGISAEAQTLLNSFRALNENSDSSALNYDKSKLAGLTSDEKTTLGQPLVDLIGAKITYLEEYKTHKNSAVALKTLIGKLTNTNTNLIANTSEASVASDQLFNDFSASLTKLSNAVPASTVVDPAVITAFLSNLKYYHSEGAGSFKTDTITAASLTNLDNRETALPELQTFINEKIMPIVQVRSSTTADSATIASYEDLVTTAREAFDALDTAKKPIYKIQFVDGTINVENTIKNAEADFTKAAAVSTKINNMIVKTPATAAAFKTAMETINKDYNALTPIQKLLVVGYEDVGDFNNVLAVITDIEALLKMVPNTEEFRTKVPLVMTAFQNLGTVLKDYVASGVKLFEMETSINKAIDMENKINAITFANAGTKVKETRTAYTNELTATEKKYVLKEALDLLVAWEKSSTTAVAVIKQIDAITLDVTTDSHVTGFISKTNTAIAGYSKIAAADGKPATNEQQLVSNHTRLAMLIPFKDAANAFMSLKVTSPTYTTELATATTLIKTDWPGYLTVGLSDADKQNLTKMHEYLVKKLDALISENELAAALVIKIDAAKDPVDLIKLVEARADYNKLSANGKKLVTNLATLTALETQYRAAMNVVTLIEKLDFLANDYANKTIAANTAYEKLGSLKSSVNNSGILLAEYPVAQLMVEINAIRPTNADFRQKLAEAQGKYEALTAGITVNTPLASSKERLVKEYGPKLVGLQNSISTANSIDTRIDALKQKTGKAFMDDIVILLADYKRLDSNAKRNVVNAKVLTELERHYKTAWRVYDQIEKLPVHTDRTYPTKVTAANKAYDKLTTTQQGYVHNYDTKLKPILKVASLIERLSKLRIGSKTYQQDVQIIRAEYDQLTGDEKALVHNYNLLTGAESNVSTAEGVIQLIDLANPTSEEYITNLIKAREAYNALDRNQQRLVTNYKDLQTRERSVKPILKLDEDILKLDPSNARTFITKFKAAEKAYEKLSMQERTLLSNKDKFLGDYTALFNVIEAISAVKPSSRTFVEDTQAARAKFNALSPALQAQISNYALLQDHELNVAGGANVDALIRALNTHPANEFVAKVKEASERYKALSSANKKAVTLLDELKEQEKYIKPIEAAIKAIDDLSNPRNNLSRQFTTVNKALQKLDSQQRTYVSNMDQYSNLANVIHAYDLIEKLKKKDKYYLGNLEAAKLAYDKLSMEEKLKVTNYDLLLTAQLDVSEVHVVVNLINSLSPTLSTYFEDIEKATASYKTLSGGVKSQVYNYKDLQEAEKDMKAAQRVIKQITDIDSSLRTFASRTKSAVTAYERLTVNQKQLVSNYNILQNYRFELGL